MADKKTSQETSGAPLQKGDLWRIARIGSNYKLTSEELFCETFDYLTYLNRLGNNELVAGRSYIIQDVGYNIPHGKAMVTATSPSSIADWVYFYYPDGNWYPVDSTQDLSLIGNLYYTTGNIIKGIGNTASPIIGLPFVQYSTFDNVTYTNFSNLSIANSDLQGVIINDANVQMVNCKMRNVTINCQGSDITLENCEFSNCVLNITKPGQTLVNIKIDGQYNGINQTYNISKSYSNGVVIAGEFSTVMDDVFLDDPIQFDQTTNFLTLYCDDIVGILRLYGGSVTTYNIQYTKSNNYPQYHTPIKFIQGTSGIIVTFLHSTNISTANPYENIFADHHGANDTIEELGSYVVVINQQNYTWENFMFREIVNFKS